MRWLSAKMPDKKTSQIKVRVPESMRPELEAIAEERGESTSVIVRERLRSGVYFDPELARKLAEIAKEESTTVAQIVERFVKDGIACRA
jgi:predicted DNA-binding protein